MGKRIDALALSPVTGTAPFSHPVERCSSRPKSGGHPMGFANELEKLNRLRKSGLITELDFQQSKKRLLEECVRRIESFHERNSPECALGQTPVNVAEAPVERPVPNVPVERPVPTVPVERPVPNVAAGTIPLSPPGDNESHAILLKEHIAEEDFSSPLHAEELNDHPLEELNHHLSEEPNDDSREELNDQLLEDCVRRIETFYDRNPTYRERWGLPRFKLVHGVVTNVCLLSPAETETYGASMDVGGRRIKISSSSALRIAEGDRITLGGYERDGKLVILGYRNESDGSHSDLSQLRTRYRLLLAAGRVTLFAGLIAIAVTLMLFVHMPPAMSNFASWPYAPYVLSALAAATCYIGLTFSFLGSWAKEFHDAMNPQRLTGLI